MLIIAERAGSSNGWIVGYIHGEIADDIHGDIHGDIHDEIAGYIHGEIHAASKAPICIWGRSSHLRYRASYIIIPVEGLCIVILRSSDIKIMKIAID